MEYMDKYAIVDDEFLDLPVKLESIKSDTAGTFATSVSLLAKSNDFCDTEHPLVRNLEPYTKNTIRYHESNTDRKSADVGSLLKRHLESWVQEEVDRDQREISCDRADALGRGRRQGEAELCAAYPVGRRTADVSG
ncbi:hypothetical protein MMC28_003868 [Mycoblastus sanguinarius]|nr:hypothetical protein [Mycoblastus sanguinarius]